jgi:penicillin-binding protein 2
MVSERNQERLTQLGNRLRYRSSGRPRHLVDELVTPPEEIVSRPEVRIRVLGLIAIALVGLLTYRLWSLQVVHTTTFSKAVTTNATRNVVVPATRGIIVDRTGKPLVANSLHYQVTLSANQADLDPTIVPKLAALFNEKISTIETRVKNPNYLAYQPAPVATDVSPVVVQYLAEHSAEFPGVAIATTLTRTYPEGGDTAANIIGYIASINARELKANAGQGYLPTSEIGKSGIEREYELFLRGKAGRKQILVSPQGDILGTTKTRRPTPGATVVLNTDIGLQRFAQNVLEQQILADRKSIDHRSGLHPAALNGAVVVMDPRTGAVLALASYPTYDLNSWVGGISQTNYQNLLNSGALNDYALQGKYTPGSTFKLITATAALFHRIIPANLYVRDAGTFVVPNCKGKQAGCTFHDDETEGTGSVNMALAMARSSDVYFYNLGYLFWNAQSKYGPEPIQQMASSYGLTSQTGIDMPNESSSSVDSPSIRKRLHDQYPKAFPNALWYTGDNLEMAFGQGGTQVTPIGLANAYATFANGGTRYQPEVAAGVVSPDGTVLQRYAPRGLGAVPLPPQIRNPILQGLIGVVNDPSGTAYDTFRAYATYDRSKFVVAGKTGTASNQAGQEPNSWFVGFAPAQHPRYVVLAVIDQGGYGASAAAPIVAKVFNYLAQHPVGPVDLSRSATGQSETTTTRVTTVLP